MSNSRDQVADLGGVRTSNLSLVLRHLRANARCSRADIAATTGLNKATVSSLVGELIDRRLLKEIGVTENRIGRPATMLILDRSLYVAVGIEINVDYLTAVAIDLAGEPLLSWRRAHDGSTATPAKSIAAIAALARRVANRMAGEGRQIIGLTVAVPGLLNRQGLVQNAPNLGWHDVDLLGGLNRALRDPSFPVAAENDANLGVLAEQRFGGHSTTANLVYVTGEIGVGAGIIMDSELRRGGRGYSGEIGHVQIDPTGPLCGCGRIGCLEVMVGIGVVLARTRDAQELPTPAELEPEVEAAVARAGDGDPATVAALAELGSALGQGMSIMANLLNPDVIVLGGYYIRLGPWILPAARERMRRATFAGDSGGSRLVVSRLGHRAAALGGAAQVLDTVDSGALPRPL